MYKIAFYKDSKGNRPIAEYLEELARNYFNDKNSRINFDKITAHINQLCKNGTRIGKPVTKHLDGEIWELRPLSNRILYAYYKDNTFVFLHHFIKKTQKTPPRELEQAKRNLADYIKREGE